MKTSDINMTVGNPYKLIVKFSIPLVIGNLFQTLYNTVDSIVVGKLVGEKALAAVGAGMPFLFIMLSIFIGLGIATTVIVATYYGAKDYANLNLTISTIYKTSIFIVIPLTIISYFSTDYILELMSVQHDGTFEMTSLYVKTLIIGMVGNVGFNTNSGILQGLGDSKTSLKFLIISTITNIVLDVIFVGPLKMGVMGAGLATIISQFLSFVLGIMYMNKAYKYLNINFLKLDFDKNIIKRLLKLGMPAALQNATFSLGSMALYSLVNSYGSLYMAGFAAANKIDLLVFLPIQSISNGITTYTGQNMGARNYSRIRSGVRASLSLCIGLTVLSGGILFLFKEETMHLFADGEEVIEAGVEYLRIVLPSYSLLAFLFCYSSVLRGLGEGVVPLVSSVIGMLGLRLPLAYYFAHYFGREYMFISYGIGWIGGSLIVVVYFYLSKWKKLNKEI